MQDLATLKSAFDRDGFAHLAGFFSASEMDELTERLDCYVRDVVPTLPRSRAMMEDFERPETLKQLVSLQNYDPFFDRFRQTPRIIEVVKALLDDEVEAQEVEAFIKPPGTGRPTPAHQDGYYFCLVPNEALTFWIAMNDIAPNNGALRYVRGSHKKGVLPHGASGVLGFSQGLEGVKPEEMGEEVICPVKRGDCLIHHSLTIHSAPGNICDYPRRAVGLVYYAKRAKVDEVAQRRYQESVQKQQRAQGVV